jgi:probable Rubsico expression protein CbbX
MHSDSGSVIGTAVLSVVFLGILVFICFLGVRRIGKPTTWIEAPPLDEDRVRVMQPRGPVRSGENPFGQAPWAPDHAAATARAATARAAKAHAAKARAATARGRKAREQTESPVFLAADATVTFAEERKIAEIDEVLEALDRDLVGLEPIKRKVQEIASLLLVDRARRRFGLTAPRPNLHMCFTGPPGTGKTTMALRMAELLRRLGYLETGQLVHAMRDDLVGEYIGQTAPKTRRVLERAMGGVLFIDEAYYLFRASDSKDYGQEAIEILLQVMENERQKLVVVLAGYKDRMDEFFGSNPGMGSRIAHHLDFAPYDVDELVSIGQLFLQEANYYLAPQAEEAFSTFVSRQLLEPSFAYARTVRNDLDRARLRQAHRISADGERRWNRDDLMRLEASDILEGAEGPAAQS